MADEIVDARGRVLLLRRLQVTVTTASGRVLGRAIALPVLALAAQQTPSGALQAGGGAVITDEDGNPILTGG